MKIINYCTGTGSIQFSYTNLNWFLSVDDVNRLADKLITAERRILKAVGLHREFIHYWAYVDMSTKTIVATFDWLNVDKEKAAIIINEAKRRHFKIID